MKKTILVSKEGCDRSTAYHMSDKMVFAGGHLWITWLSAAYEIRISKIDLNAWKVIGECPLTLGNDNHCGASLALEDSGRMHVLAGSHHQSFIHRSSSTPEDAASWSIPRAVGRAATYPSTLITGHKFLHLAYRCSSEPWSLCYERADLCASGTSWSLRKALLRASSPGYCFWTNSLTADAAGTIHLLAEFYKQMEDKTGFSSAVTHLYSEDHGESWRHDDGRPLASYPMGQESVSPILSRGGGDFRPSRLLVLLDQSLAFTVLDSGKRILFCRKEPGRDWQTRDWTESLRHAMPNGWNFSYHAHPAQDRHGRLHICAVVSPDGRFGDEGSQLLYATAEGNMEEPRDVQLVPRWREGHPDWLPVLAPTPAGMDEQGCYLLHQSGKTGENCVNTQVNEVVLRLMS